MYDRSYWRLIRDPGFSWMLMAQFLGALNDNIYRWSITFFALDLARQPGGAEVEPARRRNRLASWTGHSSVDDCDIDPVVRQLFAKIQNGAFIEHIEHDGLCSQFAQRRTGFRTAMRFDHTIAVNGALAGAV